MSTIQVLVAEALRLNDLADAIDAPRAELAKLRLELAEAEAAVGAEIDAWIEASISGADAGPMPLPPPDLVARQTEIAKLESADRAAAQARESLVERKAEISIRINQAYDVAKRTAFEDGVHYATQQALSMNEHLLAATKHLTSILGVHNFLKSQADAGTRAGDHIADSIFRMLEAKFPDLPAVSHALPWTADGVENAKRQAHERYEVRLAALVKPNPNPEEAISAAAE